MDSAPQQANGRETQVSDTQQISERHTYQGLQACLSEDDSPNECAYISGEMVPGDSENSNSLPYTRTISPEL